MDSLEIAMGADPTNGSDDIVPAGGEKIALNFILDRDKEVVLNGSESAGFPEVAQGNWNDSRPGDAPFDGAFGKPSSRFREAIFPSNGTG